jgi:hypothetical protein
MLDQKYVGTTANAASAAVAKPTVAGDYALKDQNIWTVMLRAQRTW